jgi:tetratricopeptide (TPR) repeat protein
METPDLFRRQRDFLAQHPGNPIARFSLARALAEAGVHAEAREHLKVALEARPDWMAARILEGRCAASTGDTEGAIRAFRLARRLAVDQGHEGPLAEMDEALAELGAA